ncbi:Phage tail protein [compost metagenome]
MTIRDSLFFSFAGKKSVDYGIYNVNLDSGMQEEPLSASREIVEETTTGRDRPYFQRIKRDTLKFTVNFAFMETWDADKINEVTRWLTSHDYYQELYFTNEDGIAPEKIYYALVVDDPVIIHNCLKQGYIRLTFRCDSPNAYSPTYSPSEFTWTENQNILTINVFDGTHSNTEIVDSKLQLITQKLKWSDLDSHLTWADLS